MHEKEFLKYIQTLAPRSILITSHVNTDPDGLCSAFALSKLLLHINPNYHVYILLDSISKLSKQIAAKLRIKYSLELGDNQADLCILVDTSDVDQVGGVIDSLTSSCPKISIDHHHIMDKTLSQLSCTFNNPDATSTAELVLRLFQSSGITPPPNVATSLLAGIMFDTKRFLILDPDDFPLIVKLIDAGGDYRLALDLLQSKMDRPERLARLKTAQRLKIIEINGWVLAISHVSAFGASASRALLSLGADVSLVYTKEKGAARISARSTTEFYEKTRINLGEDLMIPVAEMHHGNAGGHATAAGANGVKNVKKALAKIVKILEEKITS